MSYGDSIRGEGGAGNTSSLYLSPSGDLYEMPADPAVLMANLWFQRRVSSHLTNIILYLAAARRREVQG